jgi:hypothetical protein
MKRRTFVLVSTVGIIAILLAAAGFAVYSSTVADDDFGELPAIAGYVPADAQAILGLNVKALTSSPLFEEFEARHRDTDVLAPFASRTGVNLKTDISYVVAAQRPGVNAKGPGVVIALATTRFDVPAIVSFLSLKSSPSTVEYNGIKVLIIPGPDPNRLEHGVAFLSDSEIAAGDLESLKRVIDARLNPSLGLQGNVKLLPLLKSEVTRDMLWFAGSVTGNLPVPPVAKPLIASMGSLESAAGSFTFTDAAAGRGTLTAKDSASAAKLSQAIQGVIGLGQLANPSTVFPQLFQGIAVGLRDREVSVAVNVSPELIERLQQLRKIGHP